jgi:hypothetical protein
MAMLYRRRDRPQTQISDARTRARAHTRAWEKPKRGHPHAARKSFNTPLIHNLAQFFWPLPCPPPIDIISRFWPYYWPFPAILDSILELDPALAAPFALALSCPFSVLGYASPDISTKRMFQKNIQIGCYNRPDYNR